MGRILVLPQGTCALSSKISVILTNKLTIVGAGRGASILKWTNPDGGLALTYTNQYLAPSIEGMTFLTTRAGGGTALTIALRPALTTANDVGPIIRDIDIRGLNPSADYWTDGIKLIDVWYPTLSHFTIKGKNEVTLPFSMQSGVQYIRSQGVFLSAFTMQHMQDAVLQGGTTLGEGLNASAFELVGVKNGFNLSSWTSGALAIQGIQNGHINAYARAIIASYIVQAHLSGLLIYKAHLSKSAFIGIELLIGNTNNRLIGNHIEDNPAATGGFTGIAVGTNAAYNTVIGNTCDYVVTASSDCVAIGANARSNIIIANVGGRSGAAIDTVSVSKDAGPNIIVGNHSASGVAVSSNSVATQTIFNNSPLPDQILTINSTTPSVKSSQHEAWRTANTSSTTITNLTDGTLGQRVTLLLDANTGFSHSRSFVLRSDTDIAVGAGSGHTITFIRYSDKWVEQSRSF
ncbi:hypothetical protein SAMN02745126_06573 [Enhydrobacter aerosaccus]|uniref:Right handed beta helix region n=2 Tax=Enhydrobacter aerosaccus TaxID=225324 RepID=A0A1T4TP85_9HYPH|nr:hypothetical protein SAMN02745126_06573 [Enhydrobacter aerosaccus]